jgi:hypothetical protein
LKEQWQKSDEEYHEDADDTSSDPIKYRDKIVAPGLITNEIPMRVIFAYS